MDNKGKSFKSVVSVSVVLITFIAGVFIFSSCSRNDVDMPVIRHEKGVQQPSVAPNGGGSIPSAVPGPTPELVMGMDSPLLCKVEMSTLMKKANAMDPAAVLTLNRFDPAENICYFDVKSMNSIRTIGTIETFHDMESGDHGIKLRIDKSKPDRALLWGRAALMFFNNAIEAVEAEQAIQKALADGGTESELFQITAKDSVYLDEENVMPVMLIEIRNRTKSSGN